MENIELITAVVNAFAEAMKHLDKGIRGKCEKVLDGAIKNLELLNRIEMYGDCLQYSSDRYIWINEFHTVHASQVAKAIVNSLNLLRGFFGLRILEVSEFGY